jgi:hypothetical protein
VPATGRSTSSWSGSPAASSGGAPTQAAGEVQPRSASSARTAAGERQRGISRTVSPSSPAVATRTPSASSRSVCGRSGAVAERPNACRARSASWVCVSRVRVCAMSAVWQARPPGRRRGQTAGRTTPQRQAYRLLLLNGSSPVRRNRWRCTTGRPRATTAVVEFGTAPGWGPSSPCRVTVGGREVNSWRRIDAAGCRSPGWRELDAGADDAAAAAVQRGAAEGVVAGPAVAVEVEDAPGGGAAREVPGTGRARSEGSDHGTIMQSRAPVRGGRVPENAACAASLTWVSPPSLLCDHSGSRR